MTVYARKLSHEQVDEIVEAMIKFRTVTGPDGHDILSVSDQRLFAEMSSRIQAKMAKACREMVYGTPEHEAYMKRQRDLHSKELKKN